MRRRPGRKRKPNVVRFPSGQIVPSSELERPLNMDNVVELKDKRTGITRGYQRETALEVLCLSGPQRLAGQQFLKLAEMCRRHAWDAPPNTPKVSNFQSGHAHPPTEIPPEIIDLGASLHRRYGVAIEAIRQRGRRGAILAVVAVCLENKMPTAEQRPALKDGLDALVRLWGL